MKKKVFSLMMTLLLAFVGVAKADVVTIGDGTGTTYYAPFNSLWGYSFVEQVYTASEIGTAGTINAISFNLRESDAAYSTAVDVFMKNVSRTNFSGSTDWETVTASDMVFSGTWNITPGWSTITLDTPFQYDGTSNLMIGIHEKTSGYSTRYFYYTAVTGGLISGHSDSYDPNPYNMASYSGTTYTQNYRANIQIDITSGGGGGAGAGDQLFAVQNDEVVDTVKVGPRPNGYWMEPFTFQIRNTGANTTITNLDWTPQEYFTLVAPELPADIAHDEDMDVQLTTGTSANTDWQMVAIYGNNRTAAIWNINAEPYDAQTPDVWELACTEATSFPFVEVPATAHNATLYNNYTLPFPEIPEGYDAVYKLEFANDMMLDAEVTSGADGKVALYTADFYGEGGPMANNTYNGPLAGAGGGAAGPFEAQIGEGTTTFGYFPFYTLYNYSIAENLFLATELTEAGVTTAPMTSLSWYATNETGYAQQGISIWMANVEDATLTSTSHVVTGMTLVYTGAMTPEIGWNEFVFNEGSFAWDGHSNVLIYCQRNNGTWNSTVYWESTASLPFTCSTYKYQDSGAYDPTVAQSMTTSTTRPNIIMKGGNRNCGEDNRVFEGVRAHKNNFKSVSSTETIANYTPGRGNATIILTAGDVWEDGSGYQMLLDADANAYGTIIPGTGALSTNCSGNEAIYGEFEYKIPTNADGSCSTSNIVINNSVSIEIPAGTYDWCITNPTPGDRIWIAAANGNVGGRQDNYVFEAGNIYEFTPSVYGSNDGVDVTITGAPTQNTYGPVITDAAVEAGTYYLVASSTTPDFEVTINAVDMPCPDVEGFAFDEIPADDADDLEPASVTLQWKNPAYATSCQVFFGSTYYPEPGHMNTIISEVMPVNGPTGNFTVRNLWNNTNYFWYVVFYNNGACQEGVESPHWGFTTHLNIPQNLTAVDETVFNDETITLNWNAVVDRTYRQYNVYRDGVYIGHTTVNNIGNTTYTDGPLAYNMGGYEYYVTAVYDEGESAPSDPVTVKVSGRGNVNGHVYEQDGTTGIAGATVTMNGQDEFGDNHTYTFTTDAEGYYSGSVYVGTYNGQAGCNGYQTIYEPIQGNPVNIAYNETTSPVDYMLDENFDPVCGVIAEYYPDSLDPESPYVKVYWGCGLPGSEIIEDFETGDFSMYDWQVDPTYPWSITTSNPYEGTYCMKSGGAGVASVTSNMTVTVEIPADGLMSFFGKISSESNYDYGRFFIDGVEKGSWSGAGNWVERTYDITAGTHTFMWRYTKDSSVNSNDDCFYVDYINFYKQPEPAVPGMTYDFENGTMQGWTSVDADGDGYGWYMGSEIMSGQPGNNGSSDFVLSQSYYGGLVLYPDNYLVSPMVALGGQVIFYACAQDASYAAEHFGVAVSTTNTNPSSFTMLQEWTMTAKKAEGKPVDNSMADVNIIGASRDGNTRAQGNWYQYTVDLSAYAGQTGYVAIRHFNCSDMFYLNVDDITITDPSKNAPESRRFSHYRVYRTNCYNDGPYTLLDETQGAYGNTRVLSCEVTDTVYIDTYWNDPEFTPAGVYKWGVGVVYVGNRGEEIAGPIHWAQPTAGNAKDNRAEFNYGFEGGLDGWTVIDVNTGEGTWIHSDDNLGGYDYTTHAHGGTGFAMCYSFVDYVGSFDTDSYLVSPQKYSIGANSTLSFWADNANDSYPENFSVCVATANNPTAADFTQVWSGSAKDNAAKAENRHDGNRYDNWRSHSINLSAYAGQEVWIAFHDVNYDMYEVWIDDVTITCENAGGGGGNTGNPGDLQEPRESEIVWSNCLDKNMYLHEGDVTVNVLLNSADSPEGVQVTFTNYNEVEQANYPIEPIILDGTGYYVFDSFRKGEYKVNVEFEGYVSIEDSVSIWEPTDLRYVMTEIIYNVSDLYVSSTGWAMWGDMGAAGGQGGGQGGGTGNTTFTEGFEGGLNGWNVLTVNADGGSWIHSNNNLGGYDYTTHAHGGTGFAMCYSFVDYVGAYNTDSYLITPQKYDIVNGSTLTFWADNANDSYPENFSVCVATANNPTAADFTQVWSGGAKGGADKANNRHDANRYDNWRSHSIDLSAYAGQSVYIAFHDVNYDMYEIWIDDVELSAGAKSDDRHLESFKVMCTSIDGEPIFNTNVPAEQPFCQLATESLVPGDHYICKVSAVYSTGISDWVEQEWQYIPCDNYAGTVNGLTIEGNELSWEYPGGGVTPPPAGATTFTEGFEGGLNGWNVLTVNADGGEWIHSNNNLGGYDYTTHAHGGTGFAMCYSFVDYVGAFNTDSYMYTPQKYDIVNGSTLTFWADNANDSYPENFSVCVATADNPTAADFTQVWSGGAKGGAAKANNRHDGNRYDNWRSHSIDLSAYAGQSVYIAFHDVNEDMYEIWIDDVELTTGAKGNRNPWDLMMTFNAAEAAQYGVAYDGNNFYTSNWGYSSATHNFFKYDLQGNMLEGFEIAGCGTLRGMTTDGTYTYGVANSSTVYCIDLANHNLVSTFTSAYGAMRGITYDPERDGFWVIGNWSGNLTLIDRTGAVQQTGPAPESASDLAYYKDENDVEHIYCFNNGTNDVVDWVIGNGSMGSTVFNFNNTPGFNSGSSGGCTVISLNGKLAFMGNIQQDPNLIGIYELRDDDTPAPTPTGDILGAMIFADGEWEAFVEYPTNTYTYEGTAEEVCVRMVYNGTNNLPEGNIYFSMSCPECVEPVLACESDITIHGEALTATDQSKIWWGEQPIPGNEWLSYLPIDDEIPVESTLGAQGLPFYWGCMYPASMIVEQGFASGVIDQIWYLDVGDPELTGNCEVHIYLGGDNAPQTEITAQTYYIDGVQGLKSIQLDQPVAIDGTQNLWVMFYTDGSIDAPAPLTTYLNDPNTMWLGIQDMWVPLSSFGYTYSFIQFVHVVNGGKGEFLTMNDGTATHFTNGMTREANLTVKPTSMNSFNADVLRDDNGAPVKYNVYRSTDNANYTLIGEVPYVEGQTYYEYIDTPETSADYYYQVRTVYEDGCESVPALNADDPMQNYVLIAVNVGLNEQSDDVALFPNPTKGNVTIEAVGMNHITVVSVLGQVVYDAEVDADHYTLNMSQFNAGMYTVRVSTAEGVAVRRVTVIR